MYKLIVLMVMAGTLFAQAPAAKPQTQATLRKPSVAAKSGVDGVIQLVTNGMSESLVIKQLQSEGKAYALTTPDLLKLQKAGVSENIINVMMDPKTTVLAHADQSLNAASLSASRDNTPGGAAPAPAPAPPAVTEVNSSVVALAAAPYPPDLPNTPTSRKRRVVVAAFDFGAMKDAPPGYNPTLLYLQALGYPVNTGTQKTDDIGQGIRAMLMSRLQQSNVVTVLERNAAIDREQQQGLSAKNDPATRAKIGGIKGADCIVTGDITNFGWENTTKTKGGVFGGLIPRAGVLGGAALKNKEDRAVVAIEFRIADSETSEVLLTASARGESKRKSKSLGLGGLGGGSGGVGGGLFQNGTTSSGFEKTILGEATIDAVDKIVKELEAKIPQLPAKPRNIQGRVAAISDGGIYLALSSNDGVMLGDRFEVRQINNEVFDPQTKETIALEAVKVGEIVVKEVDNKSSLGDYGGQALNPTYITGKGYQVRLMNR
jgi:curli biogenesis system outer membrane secretion channel CsgG